MKGVVAWTVLRRLCEHVEEGAVRVFFSLGRTTREHVEAIEGGPIFSAEATCGPTGLGRSGPIN
jgi:hypothetical protein